VQFHLASWLAPPKSREKSPHVLSGDNSPDRRPRPAERGEQPRDLLGQPAPLDQTLELGTGPLDLARRHRQPHPRHHLLRADRPRRVRHDLHNVAVIRRQRAARMRARGLATTAANGSAFRTWPAAAGSRLAAPTPTATVRTSPTDSLATSTSLLRGRRQTSATTTPSDPLPGAPSSGTPSRTKAKAPSTVPQEKQHRAPASLPQQTVDPHPVPTRAR
jgi:hypothetical protein